VVHPEVRTKVLATIVGKPKVAVSATFLLEEDELRALDGLTCYDVEEFLTWFYKHMGRSALEPHESGLRKFFKAVRDNIPAILQDAEEARAAFNR
jgi:hypothetical protein